MRMMEIGTYFGKRWFVADEGFEQPGLYYWNELQQAHIRVWKPGRPLDIPGEVDALRKERVVLQDENEGLRVDLRKLSDIEVIAERLAKVEDRLAGLVLPIDNFGSLLTRLDEIDARLDIHSELRTRGNKVLDERIDKVAEIIGERVSGLVDRLEQIENVDLKAGYDNLGHGRRKANPPAFPTGSAHTLEGATQAVLPVPQRGDRVRLEGAVGEVSGRRIKDGWYDVVGYSVNQFQIRVTTDGEGKPTPDWLPWLSNNTPALKEVIRHAQP